MKHEVKAISLTCDGCGQTFETLDGMVCYADDEDGKLVEETACNSDWKIMNGHHYCPACWERDDDDIIHTKDGRQWDDSGIETVEVNGHRFRQHDLIESTVSHRLSVIEELTDTGYLVSDWQGANPEIRRIVPIENEPNYRLVRHLDRNDVKLES